jgi:hypothetical protein
MAHLHSKAILGYFPTPARVAEAIARHLAADAILARRSIRLLDPCAGEGDLAAMLADTLGASSFGIELHDGRAESARARLDHLFAADALGGVRIGRQSFSLLALNPPYDDDAEAGRLEHRFLLRYADVLATGGQLVLIVPQARLAVSARFLASRFAELDCRRFPDPEFAAFGQVVLFGTRKGVVALDPGAQARVEAWSVAGLSPLADTPADPADVRRVPALPAGEITFGAAVFDAETALREVARRGAWAQSAVTEQLWPTAELLTRPLMPLTRGHRAWLVAAGYLNNVTLETADGRRALVKGRTYKEEVVTSDTDEARVVTDVIRTELTILWLDTGAIVRVGEHDPAASGATEREDEEDAEEVPIAA